MKPRRHLSLWLVVFGVLLVPSALSAQNVWTLGGRMSQSRAHATVTALDDGRVLIAGGFADPGLTITLDRVEIHSPTTGETVMAPPLSESKGYHAAVKLSDGRVAVIGGFVPTGFSDRVEIFDPVTNTWQLGTAMPEARALHLVAPLGNDRFLVAGGFGDMGVSTSADIYDAAANTWTPTGSLADAHAAGAVAVLQSGKVLIAGGAFVSSAEIYDPATGAFSSAGETALTPTQFARLVALPDGRAISVGTESGAAIYDPVANTWTPAPPMPTPTIVPGATLLADGRVLVAGGFDLTIGDETAATYIYNPAIDTWSLGPTMNEPHAAVMFAELTNGKFVGLGSFVRSSTAIEYYGAPNAAPVADAGADAAAFTCDTCMAAVTVNAGASTDLDGDALTYTWSIGSIHLLTTTSPIATLPVPGPVTLTLTVRDRFGAEGSDDVLVTLINVEDGYRAAIANLELQLAACQAGGATAVALNNLEIFFRQQFRDPLFELPGNTADEELARVIEAIRSLNYGQQQAIFRALGGDKAGKKP